jgi:hypothetical protein
MKRVILSAVAVLLFLATHSQARTWYINTAGTGDAPTIAAGVDSAVAGDTVLVAAGTYDVFELDMKPGIVLTSESGPNDTHLTTPIQYVLGGIYCQFPWGSPYTEISGFWLDGYEQISLGALTISGEFTDVTVRRCVFTNNSVGLLVTMHASAYVENCTFIGNPVTTVAGLAILDGAADVELWYSIMWDHENGSIYGGGIDYLDITEALDDVLIGYFLFSEDPQFCGEAVDNYFLQSDSPCAPGNHPWDPSDMRLMGALPVGCGEVKTEARSWGEVKALYR